MRKYASRSLLVLTVMCAVAMSTAVFLGGAQTLKPHPKESHLKNIRQLTHGGTNAEAYFSADGKKLIFQSTRDPYKCDQIFSMKSDGSDLKLVSTGKGRTTCSYFTPDGKRIIYASTHLGSPDCPPPADRSAGYAWALYPAFDIFSAKPDGSDMKRLTTTNGYDAEATVSPDGKKIIFTSTRDGDIDLYEMNVDGSNQRRLTRDVGYDGGAFYSQDGQWIVWRANRPKTAADLRTYQDLLSKNLVMPSKMEIMIMKADGTQTKQLTSNGAANFAPYFAPNGKQIIFSSDMNNKSQGIPNFDLYMINRDGGGLEQITWDEGFDAFPMFSNDGKKLVWAASRNGAKEGDIDIFIADWVE